jgi:hypothetical protein
MIGKISRIIRRKSIILLPLKNYRSWWENLPANSVSPNSNRPSDGCVLCQGDKCANQGHRHYSKADIDSRLEPLKDKLWSWAEDKNFRGKNPQKFEIGSNKKFNVGTERLDQLIN